MSEIKLFQGDCLEILKEVDSNLASLFLMDLPYGILNKSNNELPTG